MKYWISQILTHTCTRDCRHNDGTVGKLRLTRSLCYRFSLLSSQGNYRRKCMPDLIDLTCINDTAIMQSGVMLQGTTLWRARSTLERCLFIISAALLLMVVVLSIVISSKSRWDEAQVLHVTAHNEGKENAHNTHNIHVLLN